MQFPVGSVRIIKVDRCMHSDLKLASFGEDAQNQGFRVTVHSQLIPGRVDL